MTLSTRRELTPQHAVARQDLRQQLIECTRCPLAWMGNGPVQPVGPTPNDIMLIAEAPTREDDRKRRVTNEGEPSKLLERLLREAGLDLDELFFANAVSCWTGWKSGPPARGQLVSCHDNLRAQIKLCDPKIIVTLGATSLAQLTDRKRQVAKVHGQPFKPQAGPAKDRWVWPTFHPGNLAKNPGAITTLAVDIVQLSKFYRQMIVADWPTGGVAPWC